MKDIFIWSGAILAMLLYIPLVRGILKSEIKQSFATWILWVTLDAIALASIILQDGNYLLLVMYCTGGTVVFLSLLYMKQFRWGWFENLVLSLVFICLIIWYFSDSQMATIASTIAVVISGAPQLRDSWKSPDKQTGIIYVGYTFANGLSTLGGKSWTIEEVFYPGLCTIFCGLIAIAALRIKTSEPRRRRRWVFFEA